MDARYQGCERRNNDASLGFPEVPVYRRLKVAMISTGDELVEGPGELRPGQIRDSNRRTLLAMLAEAGFEPVDLLEGISMTIAQLEEGRAEVENQYSRVVRREGNPTAQKVIEEVFAVSNRPWRGIGEIPRSGLRLADAYRKAGVTLVRNESGRTPEEVIDVVKERTA